MPPGFQIIIKVDEFNPNFNPKKLIVFFTQGEKDINREFIFIYSMKSYVILKYQF